MKTPALFIRTGLLGLVLGLFATPALLAEGAEKKAEKPIPPGVLKKYDKDGDGTLNDEETAAWKAAKAAEKKAMLEKYDTNRDGKLDADEKAAMKADKERQKKEKQAKKEKKKTE